MSNKKTNFKAFREIANKLPQYLQPTKIRVCGADILKHNKDAKMVDGTPIDSELYYMMETQVPVNHYRAIKKANARGGFEAVLEYCRDMNFAAKNALNGTIETVGGMEERKAMLTNGF